MQRELSELKLSNSSSLKELKNLIGKEQEKRIVLEKDKKLIEDAAM